MRTDEAHPAEPEPEGLCQDDAHPEGRHPEVLRQGIQWEPWRACRDVPEKTEEWGVSPESMSGYRNPTDEEKAAFLGIKMVPFLDISLILLLAAIGFFMFYLPPACLVISAICLACICCILRHAVYMGEIRQMFSSGLFQVMECRADAVYPGDPSALVLIHNAAGQYCSKVFELGKRDVQKIRRDPGRTLLLARCGGKKMHYRLFLQKNQKLLEKS